MSCFVFGFVFFFKQKTAYEMRISDWSSDVCSSDLQFDLEQVQRLDIGQAQADRRVELRIPLQQARLAGGGEQAVMGHVPAASYAVENLRAPDRKSVV